MRPTVLDLFCGCGGISLGFHLAGFQVVGGIDINIDATKTFQHNFPEAKVIAGDLGSIPKEDLKTMFGTDIDVIVGGPPCQGFSAANRYKRDEEDPRNRLFLEFIKVVQALKPKYVLIENVKGILSWNNGWVRHKVESYLQDSGYEVTSKILNASDYGVPQVRERAFFVATRRDKFDFEQLTTYSEKVTVKEAIGELYAFEHSADNEEHILESNPDTDYQRYLRHPENIIYNHGVRYPADIVQKRIGFVEQGGNWRDIPPELFSNNRSNRHSSAYKRLDESACSVTIDTGNAHSNYFHPLFNRIPTPREAARLQSFPDWFVFEGKRGSQFRQIGNAVPPLLAKAIADAIRRSMERE